jgi:hypothetical protein
MEKENNMWNKICNWYNTNDMQITWFIIGSFLTWLFVDISFGNFLGALFDLIIVVVNYVYRPR